MQTSTKIKIVAAIAVLAGPYLAWTGNLEKQRLDRLEKEGVTVPGVIEGGEWSKGKRSSKYIFEASYKTQDGKDMMGNFQVKVDYFKAHATDEAITVPDVEVRYLPADPATAILVGGSTDDALLLPVGIALFVGGLITLVVMLRRKDASVVEAVEAA